jgi:UDP-glucuronate decarboxylase
MTTILLTGGAGFVGSHLCEELLAADNRVVCLDNLGSGTRENVDYFAGDENYMFIEGDVREDISTTLTAGGVDPDSIDRIYHLASRASPTDFRDFPIEIALTNGRGTANVLKFATEVDARVLYASTSEVYGDPEVHPQPEEYRGNVSIRGERGCYDESKRYGETLCVAYHRQYGTDVRTVRIFNTYGPRMRPNDGRVVPTFVMQALQGKDLTVYGEGTQTRSFLYITDLLQGFQAVMDAPTLSGEVLNLGGTTEITINRLATVIASLVDEDIEVTHQPLPEDDPQRRKPDLTRTREQLGWEPTVELESGLEQTLQHFKAEHLDG